MKFLNKDYPDMPVSVSRFVSSGEYDQDDVALIGYDDLWDYIESIRNQEREDTLNEIKNKKP